MCSVAAGSGGNANQSVDLPVGGQVVVTVTCDIASSATLSFFNTATITAPMNISDPVGVNNSATDVDTIAAPATTGHPVFERLFRVQMNTLEQLIIFVPAILLFARYVHPLVAAALGLVFILGRWLYFRAYVRDPKRRGTGFLIAVIPNSLLLLGGLIGALITLIRYPGLY